MQRGPPEATDRPCGGLVQNRRQHRPASAAYATFRGASGCVSSQGRGRADLLCLFLSFAKAEIRLGHPAHPEGGRGKPVMTGPPFPRLAGIRARRQPYSVEPAARASRGLASNGTRKGMPRGKKTPWRLPFLIVRQGTQGIRVAIPIPRTYARGCSYLYDRAMVALTPRIRAWSARPPAPAASSLPVSARQTVRHTADILTRPGTGKGRAESRAALTLVALDAA